MVKVPVTCEHGAMTVVASLSSTGHLMGSAGAPSAAEPTGAGPPDYAAPEQFEEQEVSVGPGPQVVLDMAEWVNTGQLSP